MSQHSCRITVLNLYREIMKTHRSRLPAQMRTLGDTVVREEFKAHKNATEAQMNEFISQWRMYLQTLRTQHPDNLGRSLSHEEAKHLSAEQQSKLIQMRDETLGAGPKN